MDGKKIRRFRRRLDLSQRAFAAEIGVNWATVSRWENEHSHPTNVNKKQLKEMEIKYAKILQDKEY